MKTVRQHTVVVNLRDDSDELIDGVADTRMRLGMAVQRLTKTIQKTEILLGELAEAHSRQRERVE